MTTTKQYDRLNRLMQISSLPNGAGPVAFNYDYNLANQRTRNTLADGSYWVYQYDALGQVVSGKKYWADGTPVAGQQFEYNFDDIGNRKNTSEGGNETGTGLRRADYSVNLLNQYRQRTVPGAVDIMGMANAAATVTVNNQRATRKADYFRKELAWTNSGAASWLGVTNLAVLNNGSNPDIVTTNSGSIFIPQTPENFVFDADGNLTQDGRWNYTWDAENRLTKMESRTNAPAGSKLRLQFAYDSQGRRIQKIVSTNNTYGIYIGQSTNKFVYDGWNLIAVLGPDNRLQSSYVWGLDLSGTLQGAGGVGGLLFVNSNGTHFVCHDGNGNVSALVNGADSSISAQYDYSPFGQTLRATGPMAKVNSFRFSTKYTDDETDFLYYGYRYYNPSMGRWLSRDRIGEKGGRSLYGFVANDSINAVDGLGRIKWEPNVRESLGTVRSYERNGALIQVEWLKGKTDKGHDILFWRPLETKEYWCHGYTFDGSGAPSGPYSPNGESVPTILQDEWKPSPCACAEKGIVVFYKGGLVQHSAKLKSVYIGESPLGSGQRKLLEDDTLVTSKNDADGSLTDRGLQAEWRIWGDYSCFVKENGGGLVIAPVVLGKGTMNYNFIVAFVCFCSICGGQTVTLHRADRALTLQVEKAREMFLSLPKGSAVSNVIATLGYPDEIRIPTKDWICVGEWRRWCYGVSEPGELPSVGMIIITTNLVTLTTMRSVTDGVGPENRTDPVGLEKKIKCQIERIKQYPGKLNETSYYADLIITNCDREEPFVINVANTMHGLWQVEVYNDKEELIFSRRPSQMWGGASGHPELLPSHSIKDDVVIFALDAPLGLPRPGHYRVRVGLPLARDFVLWSNYSDLDITGRMGTEGRP